MGPYGFLASPHEYQSGYEYNEREFATDIEKNVVHGSDSPENADYEINYFFNTLETA